MEENNSPSKDTDKDYKPHGIVSRMQIKPPPEKNARRSKRFENDDNKTEVSIFFDPICAISIEHIFWDFSFRIHRDVLLYFKYNIIIYTNSLIWILMPFLCIWFILTA